MKYSMSNPKIIRFDPISMFIQGDEGIQGLIEDWMYSIDFDKHWIFIDYHLGYTMKQAIYDEIKKDQA